MTQQKRRLQRWGNQMDNKGKFKPGTRFRGNVNSAEMEVVKIQSGRDGRNSLVVIKDIRTGNIINYGLNALEKCDVTITERGGNG